MGTAEHNHVHNNIKTLRSSHAHSNGQVEVAPQAHDLLVLTILSNDRAYFLWVIKEVKKTMTATATGRSLNKSRTIAVHVSYFSCTDISLPSSAKQQGVLAMTTAGTNPCRKCIYILPSNIAAV